MADAVLFIGSDRPIRGREAEAMAFWNQAQELFARWQKEGWFERHDSFFLTAHGGDLNAATLLYGARAKLDELRRTDEFEAFVFKMGANFDNLGVVPGLAADGIRKAMARMQALTASK